MKLSQIIEVHKKEEKLFCTLNAFNFDIPKTFWEDKGFLFANLEHKLSLTKDSYYAQISNQLEIAGMQVDQAAQAAKDLLTKQNGKMNIKNH